MNDDAMKQMAKLALNILRNSIPDAEVAALAGDEKKALLVATYKELEAKVLLNDASDRLKLLGNAAAAGEEIDRSDAQKLLKTWRKTRTKLNEAIGFLEPLTVDPHDAVLSDAGIENIKG